MIGEFGGNFPGSIAPTWDKNGLVGTANGHQVMAVTRYRLWVGRYWALALVGVITALTMLVPAWPADAHAQLRSSTPRDGASLKTAPKQVVLVFGEALLTGGAATTAKDMETGERVDLGAPQLREDTVRVAWPKDLPGGQYRVAYRVVSADGHPITGAITFSYKRARVAATAVSPVTASPVASASEEVKTPAITDSAQALAPTPVKGPVSPRALTLVLAVGLIMLAALGLGAWQTRRGRGI